MTKLILLRHEKRESFPGFFSNLTQEGFKDAFFLERKLKKMKIDVLFCSPFVRTVQTIFPYCLKNDTQINIEYALHEYKHNPYFFIEPEIYSYTDIPNKLLHSIINQKYKSFIKKDKGFNFNFLENEENLEKRTHSFLKHLSTNKKYKNKTVLCVAHKGVINKIKQLLNKKVKMDDDFPMGSFEIFNI